MLDEVEGYIRQGFWGVKIKVGRDRLDEDMERLRAVRQAIGPDTPLMVDANQRWSVGEAISRVRAMEFSSTRRLWPDTGWEMRVEAGSWPELIPVLPGSSMPFR
ncbi:MAG TPA: enolase C-terminal domain-like protein [Dehalococcoidia bacterium]|nr:enolase C-terminal domain-like protein [Dehalococcoidia bacterium]